MIVKKVLLVLAVALPMSGLAINSHARNITDGLDNDSIDSEQVSRWASWVQTQVASLPSIQALEASSEVAEFQRKAAQQPLYNPSLALDYVNNDDEEYGLGLEQAIDWSNKRGAASDLAVQNFNANSQRISKQKQQALAEAVKALIEFNAARQLTTLANQQDTLLTELAEVISKRQQAGDLGQLDVELGYLSLSESLQNISAVEARYYAAEANLKNNLSADSPAHNLPDKRNWVQLIPSEQLNRIVNENPEVIAAKQQYLISKAAVETARLNKNADPTLGITVGKEGEEDVLGFNLSIPLNIRNTYSAEYEAAKRQALEHELLWQDTVRRTKNNLQQNRDNYAQYRSRLQRWESLTDNRAESSEKLLRTRWQAGDLPTSAFLFGLKQRSDAIAAGINLSTEMKKAWIDWLHETNQIQSWLSTLASNTNTVATHSSSAAVNYAVSQ